MQMTLQILSPKTLTSTEIARKVVPTLLEYLPSDIMPDRFGTREPFTEAFSPNTIDAALAAWRPPSFFLSCERSNTLVSISMVLPTWRNPPHSRIAVSVPHLAIGQVEAIGLIENVSTLVDADFAFAQIVTEKELVLGQSSGTVLGSSLAVTTHNLRKSVPDLYWLTLFGGPYIDLWGRETLMSVPAEEVSAVGDSVALRLSPSILDPLRRPTKFYESRQACKTHLDHDAFFDEREPLTHQYRVPNFATARD